MTSDQNKCSISSMLPMSCQGRAEAFARRLHSRLRSLGSTESEPVTENSWLAASENSVTSSQPRQTDPDLHFDFGTLGSPPGSPEEEVDAQEIENVINEDNLKSLHGSECSCSISGEDAGPTETEVTCSSLNDEIRHNSQYITKANMNGDLEEINLNENFTTNRIIETNGNEKANGQRLEDNSLINEEVLSLNVNNSSDCSKISLLQVSNNNNAKSIEQIDIDGNVSECLHNGFNDLNIEKPVEFQNVDLIAQHWAKQEIKKSITENIDDDINDMEEPIPRVRRCSSLKTGKTPPGTPASKKIVRFADVLGLDLADVRTFLDEIPKIPNSAYNDLTEADLNDPSTANINSSDIFPSTKVNKVLVPLFQQPGGRPNYIDRIRENQVCLDNALVDDPVMLSITGTVRVKNLDFHKTVHIRYTLDSWQTFSDVQATYVENSCDGFSDKFSFTVFANTLPVGQKLEFAIRFQCKGYQYWDNNKGANYCFQCLPPTDSSGLAPSLAGIDDNNWNENLYY